MASQLLLLAFLAVSSSIASASDPSSLQDFCVADKASVLVNGFACKDSKLVDANDFFFSGLHLAAGNTSNPVGSRVTPVKAVQIPGLNTLGISMVRIDYAPWGINPPHTHPRATEVLKSWKGASKWTGDVFVFPVGLVHYQHNVGNSNAVVLAALSSQNPGAITVANTIFGSKPDIPADVLAKSFQVDSNVVFDLQAKF
ncbi:hypothetical protein FF1_036284 [Malus domestica]